MQYIKHLITLSYENAIDFSEGILDYITRRNMINYFVFEIFENIGDYDLISMLVILSLFVNIYHVMNLENGKGLLEGTLELYY